MIARILSRNLPKLLETRHIGFVRLASTNDNYQNKSLCGPPTPPPSVDASCAQPQPCPEKPVLPSRLCPQNPDPGNPCNYCPPCPDSDKPDLSRIKKYQCLFQTNTDLPIYLRKGASDAVVFQFTVILVIFGFLLSLYNVIKFM